MSSPARSVGRDGTQGRSPVRAALSVSVLTVLFAGLWLTLAGPTDPGSWVIGVPAVIAAVWARQRLVRVAGRGPSLLGAARLLPVFVIESFKGGIDVARRVLGPRLDVEPGLASYRLGLAVGPARVFFVDLVSLLPGTLSADLDGDRLVVHLLDRRVDAAPELARLERHVARLFREPLPEQGAPAP